MNSTLDKVMSEEEYYKWLFTQDPEYSTPFPNLDEAVRWAKICEYLSQIPQPDDKGMKRKLRILDIGCGRGWLTNLASCFGSCDGIEPVAAPVELARRNYPHLNFYVGTLPVLLESPDFKPYDVIICSEVIEHVEDKQAFLKNMVQCLAPKGHVIITTPRGEEKEKYLRIESDLQPLEEWLTEKELHALFRQNNFYPLKHDRAYLNIPQMSFLYKAAANYRLATVLDKLGMTWAMKALQYKTSIYQVWWFQLS